MCILTLKIALVKSNQSRCCLSFILIPQPSWKFLSRSLILLWVLNVYYLKCVCLHVCEYVYSLFASCHLAEMDSLSQLARRALSSAISWRNKETAIRAPWREGSVACSPLRGFISTKELFWQNHWIGCRSQIPGTSNQDRFPVHPQTTQTPLPLGNRRSRVWGVCWLPGLVGITCCRQKGKEHWVAEMEANNSLFFFFKLWTLMSGPRYLSIFSILLTKETHMLIPPFSASSGSRFLVQQTLTSNESNFSFSD